MRAIHILPLLLLVVFSCRSNVAETPLTDWDFSKDSVSWERVSVPHSYNAADGHSTAYYRGEAHYRTTVPCNDPSDIFYLRLEGAAQKARVLVNGRNLCSHRGGYTPFWVNLSGVLHKGDNTIEVVCDNSEDVELIPVSSDFNKNGGLHNPVVLMALPQLYMDPAAYGFDRFHLVQTEVSQEMVRARVKTRLCNATDRKQEVKVRLELRDAEGKKAVSRKETVVVPARGHLEYETSFVLEKPHLWNGIRDPYLYDLTLTAGEDEAEAPVGFRYFSLDREKGFCLNGEPYPLRGVSMHQDMDGKASALSKADYDADYATVKELGCNFLRLAHYPHNNYAFKLCDRSGLVVQTEIPWVNICGVRASEAYFDNIHSQMEEMIRSLYNHPSIVFWGMWNELDSWGNKEQFQGALDARRAVDETTRLYEFAKSLDPTRLVGLTDDSRFARDHYTELKADYYSENRYYGWYYTYNDFSGVTGDMKWIRDNMGPANLSEYGVGINPFCHTWNEADIRRYPDDSRHPEAYGNRSHEAHVQQIAAMPFLGFTSLWILHDFPVADRREGYMDSDDGVHYVSNENRMFMNDKGLITRDRNTRKDVFYLYKAWWNKSEPTVYITERRLRERPAGEEFTLTVYSNASVLTLYRNGEPLVTMPSSGEISGVIWKFPVTMGQDETVFKVVSDTGVEDEVSYRP